MICRPFLGFVLWCGVVWCLDGVQYRRMVAVADAHGSQFARLDASSQQQRYSGFGPSHSITLELEQLPEPDVSPLKDGESSHAQAR